MNASRFTFAALCLLLVAAPVRAQPVDQTFSVNKNYDPSKLIPIALSGFTGEVLAVLKFDLEVAGCAVVSPDEAQVLVHGRNTDRLEGYVSDRANNYLLSKAYAGPNQRQLAHAFADEVILVLTKSRGIAQTQVAFKVRTAGGVGEIYISDYDGHNARPLTRDGVIVAAPSWGAGNRSLFYTSYKLKNPDVFAHDLGTGERRIVARFPGSNLSPAASPDGRQVAMVLSKDGCPDVYLADADGRNLRQITHTREGASSPCWSPDGRFLCYVSRESGPPRLFRIPAGGGAPQRIMTTGASYATEPDWSPDGKWIAFTTLRGEFEICLVPAGGGEAVSLGLGEDPTWAPNSRTILFAKQRRGGPFSLSLLDVPTKRVKDVPLNLGNSSQPAWAR